MIQARSVLQELKKQHISHIIGLPDNSSAGFFQLASRDEDVKSIFVTREGEAFAIAAGLWLGGKRPVILIQNTGLLESGDGLRGTALRMRVPLVCLITYRGYHKRGHDRVTPPFEARVLDRADLDSAALVTEPTLKAWGVPYYLLHDEGGLAVIPEAFSRAGRCSQPVAVLITDSLG